ncbi:MAG: 2-oxoacid:acceptor oxidoreductase family protein [Burkholderiales bacterium]
MFRIRLHGRGGQGIKTAGQILGSAFFISGYQTQDAPRYGAERRGAPVLATVRAAHEPINERGAIAHPDLIVVADASLFQVPTAGVLQGARADTVLLIACAESSTLWRERLAFAGRVFTYDPAPDAAFAAIALVGAAARMIGVIVPANLAEAIRAELPSMDERSLDVEIARARRAFDAFAQHQGVVHEATMLDANAAARPDWIDLPLESARVSSPDVRAVANSVLTKTGLWRTQRPVIDYARCNRCSWICSTLCPDSAIVVGTDRAPAIDYDHCKGCLVCVTVCPPHAITVVPENGAISQAPALEAR